jgi:hypothetical protein
MGREKGHILSPKLCYLGHSRDISFSEDLQPYWLALKTCGICAATRVPIMTQKKLKVKLIPREEMKVGYG